MVKITKYLGQPLFTFKIILLLLITSVVGLANQKNVDFGKKNANLSDSLESIKICKWKDGAKTCVNFSFDDGLPSFRRISQVFDLYNFKASFFIIATTIQIDSIKDIYARGHEIASHSYSHPLFEVLDSSQIEYQIRKGKEVLENVLGVKCVTFGEPGNFRSQSCKAIAFKQHLFVRHYSEYDDINRIELDLQPKNLTLVIPTMLNGIAKGTIVEFVAHSINGEGFSPINETLLMQQLDLIRSYSNNGDIWVTTCKEGFCYENLYHEISLNKMVTGDTLKINFQNYNREKYADLDASNLSIEIPFSTATDLKCLTNFVGIKKLSDKFVLTTDLKRDTTLIIILNKPIFSYQGVQKNTKKDYLTEENRLLNYNIFNNDSLQDIFFISRKKIFANELYQN